MQIKYDFGINDYDIALKQHINLSDNAWDIINSDMQSFSIEEKSPSLSGFLNRVFKNFYQSSSSTISLRVEEKIQELTKLYSTKEFSKLDKKTIDAVIKKYAKTYEEQLINKVHSYAKESYTKFYLNKENLDILRESQEAVYYDGSIGLYLRAIFEDYASKPSYIREQIYFSDIINKINLAILGKKKLKIIQNDKISVYGNKKYNRKFYISPYKIVQDRTYTFNYIIGFSEEIIDSIELDENNIERKVHTTKEKSPACFRISRIKKADIQSSMGSFISQENIKLLDNQLLKKTAMYMASEIKDIKIRFTDKGLEAFKRQIYMRPQFYDIDKTDKHIYIFHCTEIQAMNYFFKFGWDVFVMEPEELSIRFKKRYERSLKSYQGMTKDEIIQSEKDNNK